MAWTADDLPELTSMISDAAIESQLWWFGFRGSVDGGFEGTDGTGNGVYIAPLGARYNGSTLEPGGRVTDIQGRAATVPIPPGWPFSTLEGMIEYYRSEVSELFTRWTQRPRPDDFSASVQATKAAASTISLAGNANPAQGEAWPPATDLYTDVQLVNDRVGNFQGEAMWHLQEDVTTRMTITLPALAAVSSVLYSAAHAESLAWRNAADGLTDIMVTSVDAMKAARGGGGGDIKILLSVVGGLTAIAGTALALPTGGASLGAGFAVAGTILQTASDVVPEKKDKSVTLGADNPVAVLGNIRAALEDLSSEIATEEKGIQAMVRAVSGLDGWENGDYDLSFPRLLGATEPSYFAGIEVEADELRRIATKIDDEVTPSLSTTATHLHGANEFDPWSRPYGMGLGGYGGWGEYSYLVNLVEGSLNRSKSYLDHCADVIRIIARSFTAADAAVREELAGVQSAVENDPALKEH